MKRLSEEHKRKLSEVRRGKKHTEESKRKMSEAHKGKKPSEETKQKISEGGKGRIVSDETRKKMSKSHQGKYVGENHPRWGKNHTRETIQKISGKNHWNWKGGISYELYGIDWTKTLRRSIRERDHYICQLCGMPQRDRALDVHHIDYDTKNHNPNNLISLCQSCHAKTNFNKEFWRRQFVTLLESLRSRTSEREISREL